MSEMVAQVHSNWKLIFENLSAAIDFVKKQNYLVQQLRLVLAYVEYGF